MTKKLTAAQEAFATGVGCGLTQAEAYRRAYPKSQKWKDQAVWVSAAQLAAKPNVSIRIKELVTKAAAKNEVTVERIVAELCKVAFGSKRALMKWGPEGVTLIDSDTLSDEDAANVAEVSETTSKDGGSIRLKTHDKIKALELLGRHVGIFKDENGVKLTALGGVSVYLPDNGRRRPKD